MSHWRRGKSRCSSFIDAATVAEYQIGGGYVQHGLMQWNIRDFTSVLVGIISSIIIRLHEVHKVRTFHF